MFESVSILGAGESGIGAALLSKQKGYRTYVSDMGEISSSRQAELIEAGIEFESGQHTEDRLFESDIWVVSPGISLELPIMKEARSKGIETISEIEFAALHTDAKLIGISGTNGKTTTTMLVYHLLKSGGLDVACVGNVGKSFARSLSEKDSDYFVLELSSFQLDGMFKTRLNYAILLNITPDHLDRYDSFDDYANSKFRLLQNQTSEDYFIYCSDDKIISEKLTDFSFQSQPIPFSISDRSQPGAYMEGDDIIIDINQPNNIFTMNFNQMTISGKHNSYNSMAAAIVANSLMIRSEVIRESLMDFKNVEHRLEYVSRVKGIQFINDSKATNVNAAWYALESVPSPIIWIAGGIDKGNDYEILERLVSQKVRILICLGKNNIRLHQAFAKHVDMIINTTSAAEAVRTAYSLANSDESVLLSPACASFDLFDNYEDRGRQFKLAVRNL